MDTEEQAYEKAIKCMYEIKNGEGNKIVSLKNHDRFYALSYIDKIYGGFVIHFYYSDEEQTDRKAEYEQLLKENERLRIEFQAVDQECDRLEAENHVLTNQVEKMKSCRNCKHSDYRHALIFCDEDESLVLCKRHTGSTESDQPDLWELKND